MCLTRSGKLNLEDPENTTVEAMTAGRSTSAGGPFISAVGTVGAAVAAVEPARAGVDLRECERDRGRFSRRSVLTWISSGSESRSYEGDEGWIGEEGRAGNADARKEASTSGSGSASDKAEWLEMGERGEDSRERAD